MITFFITFFTVCVYICEIAMPRRQTLAYYLPNEKTLCSSCLEIAEGFSELLFQDFKICKASSNCGLVA